MKSVTRNPIALHRKLTTEENADLGLGIQNLLTLICSANEQSDRVKRDARLSTTMESRPSPGAASRAWALRRTPRRSPLPCRLCSTPPLSPGPQNTWKDHSKIGTKESLSLLRSYGTVVSEEHSSARWNALTVLMDLAELERCPWMLCTEMLNLSVAFLVPKLGLPCAETWDGDGRGTMPRAPDRHWALESPCQFWKRKGWRSGCCRSQLFFIWLVAWC